jgi:hypothetical protein
VETSQIAPTPACAPSLIIKDKAPGFFKYLIIFLVACFAVIVTTSIISQENGYKTVMYRLHVTMLNGERRTITMAAVVLPGDYLTLTDGCIYIQNTARCNPMPYCGVKEVVLVDKNYADN